MRVHKPFLYRCGSLECITASRRCDDRIDCADSSDEFNCPTVSQKQCSNDEFKCASGKQCIPKNHYCDMHNDCEDKSDEINCQQIDINTKCGKLQHKCPGGKCIDMTALCDGENDCEDGSDELRCPDSGNTCKVRNMFTCASGQCVSKDWVCDGISDCLDGDDEHNCRKLFDFGSVLYYFLCFLFFSCCKMSRNIFQVYTRTVCR